MLTLWWILSLQNFYMEEKMEKYDRNKFVVLVSAGPSARNVEYSSKYYTAGVNVTPNFLEKTNYERKNKTRD